MILSAYEPEIEEWVEIVFAEVTRITGFAGD
jgi:hypothetical protein